MDEFISEVLIGFVHDFSSLLMTLPSNGIGAVVFILKV